MTERRFRAGDRVTWQSHGSTVHGEVTRELTGDAEAAGRTVRASRDDPQYLVRSDASAARPSTGPARCAAIPDGGRTGTAPRAGASWHRPATPGRGSDRTASLRTGAGPQTCRDSDGQVDSSSRTPAFWRRPR
jgi:hypothetical protein